MDIKSKKSKKVLFITAYVVCVLSFLTFIVGLLGASTLNAYTGYMDPYFMQNGNDASLREFLLQQGWNLSNMETLRDHLDVWTFVTIISGIAALVTLLYLVVAVGERDQQGKIRLNRFDHVFAEVQLAAICFLFFYVGAFFTNLVDQAIQTIYGWEMELYGVTAFDISVDTVMAGLLGGVAAALGLGLLLSCIKKVKANKFVEYSLCKWLFGRLYTEVYMGGSTMRKVVLIAVLICLLSATMFLAPVILIVILVFAPKWVKKYDEIKKGIDEVSGGNLDYKIPVEGDGELDQLAEGINKIADATSAAVESELKNQQMKTDLISNVSHDLKTPLTSMVTYIDLMKTEGLESENAPKYLEILEQKTERLRQLTEDLFEAAKASSGAIPVRMSRVDFLSLLNQGLGEMNEKVEASNLEFVINARQERYFVKADGQLLWRVIANLLSNVLKYSQENTRVYIDFQTQESESGDKIIMEMKNISSQSLNIDPSELMERFKRGDESRSTEGSGLGLAIAKDLMKLMQGSIDILIDGDLFKVKVILPAASEDEPTAVDLESAKEDLAGQEWNEAETGLEREREPDPQEPAGEGNGAGWTDSGDWEENEAGRADNLQADNAAS